MTVPVQIFAKEMDVSNRLQEYIEKKFTKLDRFLETLDDVRVELRYNPGVRSDNDRYVSQVTIRGKNMLLRSEERSEDIFAAVDAALDKLERRIEKYKGKHFRVRTESHEPERIEEVESAKEVAARDIVRRKAITLEPMTERDAIEQMGMLGHEAFYMFLNVHTGKVNLIYRRRDGLFGVIEADLR